jgi:hypothetical protein
VSSLSKLYHAKNCASSILVRSLFGLCTLSQLSKSSTPRSGALMFKNVDKVNRFQMPENMGGSLSGFHRDFDFDFVNQSNSICIKTSKRLIEELQIFGNQFPLVN